MGRHRDKQQLSRHGQVAILATALSGPTMWHIVWNASRHVFSSCDSEARLAYFCPFTALCFSREAILSVQRPKKHRKFSSFWNGLGNGWEMVGKWLGNGWETYSQTIQTSFLVRHDLC